MADRCERTDLFKDQCAHCLSQDISAFLLGNDRPPPRSESTITGHAFGARYRSRCGGGDEIEVGDDIVMYGGEAWHVSCAVSDGARVAGINAPTFAPRRNPPPRPRGPRPLEDPYG